MLSRSGKVLKSSRVFKKSLIAQFTTRTNSGACLVNVHNEWDPVEEIIVGTSKFAVFPNAKGDPWFKLEYGEEGEDVSNLKLPMNISQRMIDETEEDLDVFASNLTKLGITVRRPDPIDSRDNLIKTYDWEVEPYFCYCPRDLHLAIGNSIIEVPSPSRARYLEVFSYHKIMYEYFDSGAKWISAPKQRLADSAFNLQPRTGESVLRETEMMFDAANVLRCGKDILYLVSDSGNERGLRWLQSTLGPEYTVHACRDLYSGVHIDTTLVILRPGLILLNPKVKKENIPKKFQSWDVIRAPEMQVIKYPAAEGIPDMTSQWLGMNMMMLSPTLAAVDANQPKLMELLKQHGIDSMPVLLRHGRVLGGGIHCVTLDTRRRGQLESYF